MKQLDLSWQHAIITGGAVGLDFAIAQRILDSATQTVLVNVADHTSVKEAVGSLIAHCLYVVKDSQGAIWNS